MNKNLLKGKIVSKGLDINTFANEINVSKCALYRKLNGTSKFTCDEIQATKNTLALSNNEICDIFFVS